MPTTTRGRRKPTGGARRPLTADARVRKQQLLDVAARLFKERGYHGATLQDVADEIGVTRSALYHYFSSKEEILYLLAQQALKEAAAGFQEIFQSDAPPDEKMRGAIRRYIHDMIRLGSNFWVILSEGEQNLPPRRYKRIHELLREQDALFQKMFQDGVQSGKFYDLNPKLAVFAMAGMCNWLSRWYKMDGEHNPNSVADTFLHLLEHGYLRG